VEASNNVLFKLLPIALALVILLFRALFSARRAPLRLESERDSTDQLEPVRKSGESIPATIKRHVLALERMRHARELLSVGSRAQEGFESVGVAGATDIARLLTHSNRAVRRFASFALCKIADDPVLETFRRLAVEERDLEHAYVTALAQRGSAELDAEIVDYFEHDELELRAIALAGAAARADGRLDDALILRLAKEDEQAVIVDVGQGFLKGGRLDVLSARWLELPSEVRWRLAEYLPVGQWEDQMAQLRPFYERILDDPDRAVVAAAERAISRGGIRVVASARECGKKSGR